MPLTSQIIEEIVDRQIIKHLIPIQEKINIIEKKLDKALESIDWFMGKYSKIDDEQIVMSSHVSSQSKRLDDLETKVFGTIQ